MPARRLRIVASVAAILGIPVLYSLRAQTTAQPDDCKRVYGGLGIAYEMCTYQRSDWTIALAGSTYKLRNVAGDNVTLQFVRSIDAAASNDNILIPYSAIHHINIVERRRELAIYLTPGR